MIIEIRISKYSLSSVLLMEGSTDIDDWSLFDSCLNTLQTPTTSPETVEVQNNSESNSPKHEKCSNCQKNTFVTSEGNYCCTNCGFINEIGLHSSELSFNNSSGKGTNSARMGLPTNPLLPKSSLGSTISNRRGYTKSVQKMCNYHKWNSMPYKERSLWNVYTTIQNNASIGGLSQSLIKDAKAIYKKLSEVSISRGSNRKGLIAACVYISCKNNNVPRSAKEIASMFNLNVNTLTRGTKKLMNILRVNHIELSTNDEINVTSATDFIERFCSILGFSNSHIMLTMRIAEKATDLGIVEENTPPSIASGCIYYVSQLLKLKDCTKKDISKVCRISEVTIGKCFKKLQTYESNILQDLHIEHYK